MNEIEQAKKLLSRNRIGALLRIFATSEEVADLQINSALKAARKLCDIKIDGHTVFSRIDFLVSDDQRFEDSDTTNITERLRIRMSEELPHCTNVRILNIKQGDIYCMLLNYGIVNHLEDRVPFSFIISHNASEYITENNIVSMLAAMQNKARVAGLAINLLEEQVRKGCIANTFALWHNKSLMTVGGFDLRSAKPRKGFTCDMVTGTCAPTKNGAEVKKTYHVAGCEEIIPLVRMINNFGPCIKYVEAEDSTLAWGAEEASDPVGYERHISKIASKIPRQKYFAGLQGVSLDYLQKGLLD
jgi:hypothetical protein